MEPCKQMPASKHSIDNLIAILNRFVTHPHAEMKATAKDFKLSPVSLLQWQAQSARDEAADLRKQSELNFAHGWNRRATGEGAAWRR